MTHLKLKFYGLYTRHHQDGGFIKAIGNEEI